MRLAYRQSSGVITTSARTRGRTRNSIGDETEGRECIDLLVHLHGAELRGERGAGAAGEDDADHHGGHVPGHADPDQIGDVDLGAELEQLDGSKKGEDHADEKADHADDRQRLRAHLLEDQHQIGAAKARLAAQEAAERDGDLAEEGNQLAAGLHEGDGFPADPGQEGLPGGGPTRPSPLGHRRREAQQAPYTFRQAARVRLEAHAIGEAVQSTQKDEQTAVPAGQTADVNGDAPDAAAPFKFPFDLGCRRQRSAQTPAA